MYNLGDHFKNTTPSNLVTNDKAVFRGSRYRISLLTPRLIRLEYNSDGVFNNRETAIVKKRNFPFPEFSKKEDDHFLIIETMYFTLTYLKGSNFGSRTLYASFNGKKDGWYYGKKEVRNLGGTYVSLDNTLKNPILYKGLFSTDGIVTIDDSKSICFDENSNYIENNASKSYIDLYLFIYGKDFGSCLADFFYLTGNPPLIPRYALGNWWSKEEKYSSKDVNSLIEKFTRHNIPLSVFMLDSGWANNDNHYPNIKDGFSFNKELYPNVENFINEVHKKNIKIGVKINPQYGFFPFENYYDEAKKYLLSNKKGIIEFNPKDMKNIDVFLKIFIHPLKNSGIDIIWNDYYDKDIDKMYLLNYYLNKDSVIYNKRNIMLSRNPIYNAHLNNVLYSGHNAINWEVLQMLPYLNNASANIGACFWSHDVGGSVGGIEDSDFYLRSLQFGVFSPILRFNTEKGKYFKREPWKWDVVTEKIASDYLRMRHKLIPYIYSEAYYYHKEGKLLIQPFYYYNLAFYDDKNYVNQYYFGNSFMISPIISPMDEIIGRTIQKFFIPEGVWYDFKTGKRFIGNHKYIAFYPISDYPIFVKQGSIIPMAADDSYMDYKNPKTLEIHVFPGESNTYRLYEDDGESFDYLNGKYSITELDYNYRKSNYTLIIRNVEGDSSVLPPVRNYKIVFRNTKKSENVVVYSNEKQVENIKVEDTDTDFIVYINNVDVKDQLVINCYGEDIEIDSIKLIKDDIDSILSDLKINTVLKDDIAAIVFNDELSLGKKRILIRKLKRRGLDTRTTKIFLKLLEYMEMEE